MKKSIFLALLLSGLSADRASAAVCVGGAPSCWTSGTIASYCDLDDLISDFNSADSSGPIWGDDAGYICAADNWCHLESGMPVGTHYYMRASAGSCTLLSIWALCPDCTATDSDGDGIPDSTDPCPQNPDPACTDPDQPGPDSDGDGLPDNTDPCPQNPNPNCTDPNIPPGPDIPGDIVIGDCAVDITALRAWILSDDSFPFNLLYRVYSIISPLFALTPAPPVIEFEIPIDPSSRYSWVPDKLPVRIDFVSFDIYAIFLRWLEAVAVAWAFAKYGIGRFRNFAGSGD